MAKKQKVATISGKELMMKRKGKLSRHEGVVKSGTGYHKSDKVYNRKSKKNQQLKARLKDYGPGAVFLYPFLIDNHYHLSHNGIQI